MAQGENPFKGYHPSIEYFGQFGGVIQPLRPDFQSRFNHSIRPAYPAVPIQEMKDDQYDPTIIGYSHRGETERRSIIRKLSELSSRTTSELKVLHEIDPQALEWIKDFLRMEREFEELGTVNNQPAASSERTGMRDYRMKLGHTNSGAVALWCLDNGLDISSVEHPDVKKWIGYVDEEESFGVSNNSSAQAFVTAIKRDLHGIQQINRIRPNIISVGAMHALKYDMLLGRGGEKTFYYLNKPFNWEQIIDHWETAHYVYPTP